MPVQLRLTRKSLLLAKPARSGAPFRVLFLEFRFRFARSVSRIHQIFIPQSPRRNNPPLTSLRITHLGKTLRRLLMKKTALALGLFFALAGMAFSQQGAVPSGIPHLDHVFYIMMENHGYREIMNNPNAPFINSYAMSANLATNYYGVGTPQLDQLSRSGWRIELRHSQRQFSRLA